MRKGIYISDKHWKIISEYMEENAISCLSDFLVSSTIQRIKRENGKL